MAYLTKQNTSLSNRPKFSVALQSEGYKKLINDTLGDPKIAQRFIANISSVVSNNYKLQECEPASILNAGFQAESLNLPLNQSLGYAYVVPYRYKAKFQVEGSSVEVVPYRYKAQFQVGYKGYVQLAIRSGQYLDIDVFTIKDGEYKGRDKNTGRPIFEFIEDDEVAEKQGVIGYMATFTLLNGFNKQLYWSKEKVKKHAEQYSKSYGNDSNTDLWTNAFDLMAMKTVLKQLLSKYGLLSVELQQAIEADQAVIDEKGNKEYVDNPDFDETPVISDTGEVVDKAEDNTPIVKTTAKTHKKTVLEHSNGSEEVSGLFETDFNEEF